MIGKMKVRITAKLETSNHDGYCSGGECEYEVKTQSHIADLPIEYKNYPEGNLDDFDEYGIEWENLLPIPELNNGSGYCDIPNICYENGLGCHDYRYTIISVEIINQKSINKNNEYIEKLDMTKIFKDN